MEQSHEGRSSRGGGKSATAAATAAFSIVTGADHRKSFAQSGEKLKLGLIGCGGRGTGAVTQALMATDIPIVLWAMGDLFRDKLDLSYKMLADGAEGRYDREPFASLLPQMDVPEERRFIGFDACQQVIDSGVDLVILATPPVFRPGHFTACVEAGKHVFMEKPAATDPTGVRVVIEAARKAREKGLSVVAGSQRRHQQHYIDILRRVHDGAIGEIVGGQYFWNGGGSMLTRPRPQPKSDIEWQCRNWYHFAWLSGDHIVEQHVHNLDVMAWAMQDRPVSCLGMGGRMARVGDGNNYDHFAVEFEYPNGVRTLSMCRQINGAAGRVSEYILGTKGRAYIDQASGNITGPNAYRPEQSPNPYIMSHRNWIMSIRDGVPIHEGEQIAESTLLAIMGRMSAYTGQALRWNWAMRASQLDLLPPALEWGDLPPLEVAVPGKTQLV